ncbi:hypothetical protein PQX77_015528 [Marasmius sp. AFHP31]|nr:hypothetical protein PQX77_015528 [Marasmius sp. AFHP31]
MPGITSVRAHSTISTLIASPSIPKKSEVKSNLIACFEGIINTVKREKVKHAVVMFDEICTAKRPRFDPITGSFIGVCREDGSKTSLKFESKQDLDQLMDDLGRQDVHMSSETTIDGINTQKHITGVRVVSLSSDGESKRGKALVQLTFTRNLSPSSPIYEHVGHLGLMDLQVGPDDITPDKDYKHVDKRARNTILRSSGISITGVVVTPDLFRQHLRMVGLTPIHINSLFNPEDKQDVKLAFLLLKDIWSLPKMPATEASEKPYQSDIRDAIRILGRACFHLVFPYVCVDLSLSEQLEHLSAAAHLIFALYSFQRAAKRFIPTTLYIDIMLMVRNAYFCVAKSKVDDPDGEFWLILLGMDRLETLFGILRTMVGNDTNLDVYQTACRLAETTEVANILAEHPEWQKTPRRLHLPSLDLNENVITERVDHLNPQSWRGNVWTQPVTLQTCWKRGRRKIEDLYPFAHECLKKADSNPKITMLSPFGTLLFDVPLDPDDVEEDLDSDSPVSSRDITEGSRMVEDAAAEEMAARSDVKVVQTISIEGKPTKKSKALADRFKLETHPRATSSDRLKRLEDEPRYKPSVIDTMDFAGFEDHDFVMLGEPVGMLLRCDGQIFLCIALVSGITMDSKPTEEIPVDLLQERTVLVAYQALRLVPATIEDDPEGKFDWRTTRTLGITGKLPGRFVRPIDPEVHDGAESKPFYLFDSPTLVALTASLTDGLSENDLLQIPTLKQTIEFPYREQDGKACFVADTMNITGHDSFSFSHCPHCTITFLFDPNEPQRIIEHLSAHILHDPKINRSTQPCGLCLRPHDQCHFVLKKGKGRTGGPQINLAASKCQNLIKFNYRSASEAKASSPCSNVPVECPICGTTRGAVWRYNMQEHFKAQHASTLHAQYSEIWKLGQLERDGMKKIWGDREKRAKWQEKKTKGAPLTISEAHRASTLLQPAAASDTDDSGDEEFTVNCSRVEADREQNQADSSACSRAIENWHRIVTGLRSRHAADSICNKQPSLMDIELDELVNVPNSLLDTASDPTNVSTPPPPLPAQVPADSEHPSDTNPAAIEPVPPLPNPPPPIQNPEEPETRVTRRK